MTAVKANRHAHRDSAMVPITYRHGLRAAELVDLRWSQVDLDNARLHVRRVKNGVPSVHPLKGDELRALRKLKREAESSEYVFVTERRSPFSTKGFARLTERAGKASDFKFGVHPQMLRHAAGYKLANVAWTPVRCRPISDTRIFSIRRGIQRCRRRDLKTFGGTDLDAESSRSGQ
jgi:integrase